MSGLVNVMGGAPKENSKNYFLRKSAKMGKSLLTLLGQIDLPRYDLTFVYLRNTRQCESR